MENKDVSLGVQWLEARGAAKYLRVHRSGSHSELVTQSNMLMVPRLRNPGVEEIPLD